MQIENILISYSINKLKNKNKKKNNIEYENVELKKQIDKLIFLQLEVKLDTRFTFCEENEKEVIRAKAVK